jgi:hypothetical protein
LAVHFPLFFFAAFAAFCSNLGRNSGNEQKIAKVAKEDGAWGKSTEVPCLIALRALHLHNLVADSKSL